MAKANLKELHALHAAVAMYYKDVLDSGEDLSSGTLAAINTFLKNNEIKADIVEQNSPQDLSKRLGEMVVEQSKKRKEA